MNYFAMQDNVLDNQLKLDQSAALQGQTRQQALNAFTQGVGEMVNAPVRNALQESALQSQELQREEREREIVSDLIAGVERAPQHLRPRAWAHAYGQAQRMKLDLDGIPEEYDEEFFTVLQAGLKREGIEMPASVQEYIFARDQGGFDGGFLDWRQQSVRGGGDGFTLSPGQTRFGDDGSVTASVEPKPAGAPNGYRLAADGRSFEAIPGGPADTSVIRDQSEARGASTQITIGDGQKLPQPPKGTVWQMGQDGNPVLDQRGAPIAIPFQGGPAMADAAAAGEQAAGRRDQSLREASVVTEDIGRAVGIIQSSNWPTTGLFGAALSSLPGSSAHDLNKMMDTIRSNSAFGALQKMRENSPTGGALGAVSERELSLLQSTIGSLEQSQGQQQVLDNLARVNNGFLDVVFGAGNGPKRMPVSFRQGDVQSRLEFLAAQYPDDPGRVQQIMQAEGLFQ